MSGCTCRQFSPVLLRLRILGWPQHHLSEVSTISCDIALESVISDLCETCVVCTPWCRAVTGNMKSAAGNLNQDDDPNSPRGILKLVPEEFLLDHLTER